MVNNELQYTYRSISHKLKVTDNEIWSANRIPQEKYFS